MKKLLEFKIQGASLILSLAFITGCYYDQVVPIVPELPDGPVSYANQIQPFFDAKCIACHSASGGAKPNLEPAVAYNNLIDDDWVDIGNPPASRLYISLNTGGSMATYSTPTETALVLKWIVEGAENN